MSQAVGNRQTSHAIAVRSSGAMRPARLRRNGIIEAMKIPPSAAAPKKPPVTHPSARIRYSGMIAIPMSRLAAALTPTHAPLASASNALGWAPRDARAATI